MKETNTTFNDNGAKKLNKATKNTRRKAKSNSVQYAPVRYISGKAYERMLRNE